MSREKFITKLIEKFPDVATSRVVTRAQVLEVSSFVPQWMSANTVSRGTYSIDGASIGASPMTNVTVLNTQVASAKPQAVEVNYDNIDSLVPQRDSNYVPFGNYDDVETIIKSQVFYPLYIAGPTGNGKSTMVEQICAKHKRPLIRVNLNMLSDEEQLIGSKTLEDGTVKVVEGPVLIAMRTGATLLLDEIDAGGANTLLCLQPILEGKPYYFKLKNELITPARGFNIIATANTKGKGSDDGRYIGTNVLNEAFLERFPITFNQEYPPAKTELKIINNLMTSMNCVNEQFAGDLVKWADAIRRTFEDGGVDENITTRRIVHIVNAYAVFKNTKKAIELCVNRFDTNTKNAFIDLFDKVSAGEDPTAQPETKNEDSNDDIPF